VNSSLLPTWLCVCLRCLVVGESVHLLSRLHSLLLDPSDIGDPHVVYLHEGTTQFDLLQVRNQVQFFGFMVPSWYEDEAVEVTLTCSS